MSLLAVLAMLPLAQCSCRENRLNALDACKAVPDVQPDNPAECSSNADCGDHYACGTSKKSNGVSCCLRADRKCTGEAECCPGQSCPDTSKRCFDQFIACADDAECGNAGDLFCEQWTDSYGTSGRCRYKPCGEEGTCPANQSCFNGECLAELPCGGACPPGEACMPSAARTGRCQAFACPASCAPGFIATFKDSRDVWDTCRLPSVECQCAALPPLHSKDLGRYSAIAADTVKSEVLVSEYDGEFGDLVVARFDSAGKALEEAYVDGVPATGTTKYSAHGPRKGLTDPGDDVGRYTDIAVRGGSAFVSYYDATRGDLKLATRGADGTWKSFRVDGARADVGQFTSVAIDSDGLVGISYFQRGGDPTFDASACPGGAPAGDKSLITALKFARSRTPSPTQESDFTVLTLACQARPPPVCAGCSGLCANPGTGPACFQTAAGCSPSCDATSEACVQVGPTAQCAAKFTPPNLVELVDGVGLFSALTFKGKEALIAYMKRTAKNGDLYALRVAATNTVSAPVLIDGVGDTGHFPDISVDPVSGLIQIGYHDLSVRQLKFYSNASLVPNVASEVVDKGLGPAGAGDVRWVGTDVALVRAPTGQLFVLYQDATTNDLKIASRRTGWETLRPVRTEGAVGFAADGVFLGNQLFVSHARIHARSVDNVPRVDNSLLLDRYVTP